MCLANSRCNPVDTPSQPKWECYTGLGRYEYRRIRGLERLKWLCNCNWHQAVNRRCFANSEASQRQQNKRRRTLKKRRNHRQTSSGMIGL
jgi:hypothetical protein